jgi:hypothetical protein
MTVRELIEKLSELAPSTEAGVYYQDSEWGVIALGTVKLDLEGDVVVGE